VNSKKISLIAATVATILVLSGSMLATTVHFVQAAQITEEEHWKYRVDKWRWDEDRRRTYGLITPQIVIQNETVDRLEGFVADANGTRLEFYDGDQVVHVRFMSNSSGASGWQIAGRVHDGYFAIDIPERNREAEFVRIMIGNNQYTVNNGTPTTAPTEVYMNSAMLSYRINSTLNTIETEVAQVEEPKPISSAYEGGSLIDWILSQNGLLPIRGSNPGE
jgi:hypothetical protein